MDRAVTTHALIVGGGIGGLAAALALQRAGQRVTVFEAARELGEVGAGLSITPNAGLALVALGLGPALENIGSTPRAGAVQHFQSGDTLVALRQDASRERYGMPLFHVHRADLHRELAQAVLAQDSQSIRTNCPVVEFREAAKHVTITLADGSQVQGDWLIGCDGIRSTIRTQMRGPERANFTGFVAWRGVVDTTRVSESLCEPPLCMTVGPRRLLMRYPLRRGTQINIVALARRAAWTEEGWSVPADRAELLAEFADFAPHCQELLAAIPADRCFKWGLFDRDPLPTWTTGRCTLLGDAAHPMPPFTGQGAVMALEDAVILGRAAAAMPDPTDTCRRYESARRPRVDAVLAMTRARANLYFADDPAAQLQALGQGMAELRTLYEYNAAIVPI
jgi:salicylate hydroxylase